LALALATDFLDGKIARIQKTPSEMGKLIDPLCDAIFLILIGLSACLDHQMPLWFLYAVLLRYAIIASLSAHIMRKHQITLGANWSGKVTITANFMTPCFFIGNIDYWGWVSIYVSSLLMGISLIAYLKDLYIIDTQPTRIMHKPVTSTPPPID
jgi:phosphatidylglycerophosphate synthase